MTTRKNSFFRQPEMMVAAAAIVLSICGLFVALYEASIARRAERRIRECWITRLQDITNRRRAASDIERDAENVDCAAVPQSSI